MGGVGRASAKLLLFGEHAAVYGHPAVGISLPESTTVSLSDCEGAAWDLGPVPAGDREGVAALLARLGELLPSVRRGSRVRIESTVERGVGFGSSAALCGALARAALAGADPGHSEERAWGLAHGMERLFHGTPSGIDTGLALAPGMSAFAPRPPHLPARRSLSGGPLYLVVAAVPRAEGCSALVGAIGERVRAGDPAARASIEELGGCAARAAAALDDEADRGSRRRERVASLADQAMETLARLGLSTPWLEQMLDAGRAEGALGGKLSGAGGGGAFFLVARDEASAHAVAARLRSHAEAAGIPLASRPRVVVT
jgi:mevalonate kinase